jgi:hypothetical protein
MLELLESQRDQVMGLVAAQTRQILELKAQLAKLETTETENQDGINAI